MKKYSMCITAFVLAICLLFTGILVVTASGESDVVGTFCVVAFSTGDGTYIENVYVRKGGKVERPEDPVREGYIFDGWYTGNKYTKEFDFNTTIDHNTNIFAKWVMDPLAVEKAKEIVLSFDDVKKGDWFYDSVCYVFDKGLMNGISETKFDPNGKFTRAMFVTILYRMQNEPTTNADNPFKDVKSGSYYEKAVIWARQHEIVNGVSATEFAPDSVITREQIALIMYRYAKYARFDTKLRGKIDYKDKRQIADYATDAVLWAVCHDVLATDSDGNFKPKEEATRALAASVFTVAHRDLRDNK